MRSGRYVQLLLIMTCALVVPARADDDDAKSPKHKVTQAASYIEVDPMYATILDGDRPVGLLMVGVGLDVPDARLRDDVNRVMPVLRDAYLRNLMSFSATTVRLWKQPDVATIADRLQGVTDRALGRKGAKILLAQIAVHMSK